MLHSESTKLYSVRSTTATIIVAVLAGLVVTVPYAVFAPVADPATFVRTAAPLSVLFPQLVIAALGVIAIGAEYSTGMIRSSVAATPRRVRMLLAKGGVLFVTGAVTGALTCTLALVSTGFILDARGMTQTGNLPDLLWSCAGAAFYLGVIAVFALGIGAVVRSTAGGVTTAIGLLFALPVVLQMLAGLQIQVLIDIQQYLLFTTGPALAGASSDFMPWANAIIVSLWAAVPFSVGAVLLVRRDA